MGISLSPGIRSEDLGSNLKTESHRASFSVVVYAGMGLSFFGGVLHQV
jgi:hypothetical protein